MNKELVSRVVYGGAPDYEAAFKKELISLIENHDLDYIEQAFGIKCRLECIVGLHHSAALVYKIEKK